MSLRDTRPVERKVLASSIGAGAGLTISNFVLWAADAIWWPGAETVPTPVADMTQLVVTVALTFAAGYVAKHDPGYTTEVEV